MTTFSVVVFILVYLGMALGRVPGLAVDRTGVALLGLIALLASEDLLAWGWVRVLLQWAHIGAPDFRTSATTVI